MFTKNVDFMLNHAEVVEIMCFLLCFFSFSTNLGLFCIQSCIFCMPIRGKVLGSGSRIDTEMMILGVLDGKSEPKVR